MIRKSGYLPKLVGVLVQLAGACYFVNSFAMIVAPAIAQRMLPAILIPAFIGETSFCLWLLIKGADVAKWQARGAPQGN